MERSCVVLMSILILVSIAGAVSRAEIPQMISYQGKVTDASGNPVANGSYTMRFRIYNVSTGGTALWDSGARTVAVAGGVFSVLLGESPQPALTLDFAADYWLLVTFNGVDQSPRQRLASVGYAYMASGLVAGTVVSGSLSDASVITGNNTASTGFSQCGVFGMASSTAGIGVMGEVLSTTGSVTGVLGITYSSSGKGVHGWNAATAGVAYGVSGLSSSEQGTGVYGKATSTDNSVTYGVHGESASRFGSGVYGYASSTQSGECAGVTGETPSPYGRGVVGSAISSTGDTFGGYFECASSDGIGVYGRTVASGGRAVVGEAAASAGLTYGVWGFASSSQGRAVYGTNVATTGDAFGGEFETYSSAGYAVRGIASRTTGVNYGVYGSSASLAGYGGYFAGRLRATASINAGATPGNHVAEILNSSVGTSPDVLCLKVAYTGNPGSSINYLTFLNGNDTGLGAVEGDGAGGVTFLSGGSDYAEYLPKLHGEELTPGEVVGVFDGKVSRQTEGASQVMVVSTRPIVVGNSPGEERASDYVRVAFIGQVEVKVRGAVKTGDLLLPSGMGDGTAVAVSREDISAEQFQQAFGQAWEESSDSVVKRIHAAVGLLQHDPGVARLEAELDALRQRVAALEGSR